MIGRQRTSTAPGVEAAVRRSIEDNEIGSPVVTGKHRKLLRLGPHYKNAFMVVDALTRNAAGSAWIIGGRAAALRNKVYFRHIQRAFDEVNQNAKRKSFMNYSNVFYNSYACSGNSLSPLTCSY